MKTRRRTYTAAFPVSVTGSHTVPPVPVSATRTRMLRSDTAKEKANGGSKKKCIRRELWDKEIPIDLLQEILSRVILKANIHASLVCKTWLEPAVSMRKLQNPRPWLFYPQKGSTKGDYILLDPTKSQSHDLKFPELKEHRFYCSKDGWLLVFTHSPSDLIFFLNPFTRERVDLPKMSSYSIGSCLTFSAPPTSASCFVIFFGYNYNDWDSTILINAWRPGESVWTKHSFWSLNYGSATSGCVFLNGLFYCLSSSGCLGVFDPVRATWKMLPVKHCPAYSRPILRVRTKWMTEFEGDIFVVTTQRKNNYKLLVFKLNLELNVWEEMKESGLTVFGSYVSSFARPALSAKERNHIFTPHTDDYARLTGYGINTSRKWSVRIAWLHPPHNNFTL